jgi:uncharacterized membrane protein
MKTATIVTSLVLVALAVMGFLMPWFTRPELFFGVTVSPDFRHTPTAQRLVRTYRLAVCLVTATALATLWSVQAVRVASYAALFVYVTGTTGVLALAHHLALKYATPRASAIEVDLSARAERMPGGRVAIWVPLLWLLALGLWASLDPGQLPDRLIIHWGVHGPDRWVRTAPGSVAAVLGFTAFWCLMLAFFALAILHRSRRISTSGPAASSERQFRRRCLLLILAIEYLMAVIPALILLGAPHIAMRILSAVWIVTLIVFLVGLMRAGQGGTHLASPSGPPPVGDRTDDASWLGGLVYFNRADHALLVEKRMGLGWTFNLGNPWAWLLLAGLCAVPVVLRVVLRR